jgi:N utilization substance protein B
MSCKQSRELAFRLIFGLAFDKESDVLSEDVFAAAVEDFGNAPIDAKERAYIENLCTVVREKLTEIDALIGEVSKGFAFDRIYKTDLTVIRLAIGELMSGAETDSKVIINEALDIAKKYGTEKSTGFVNGVLASAAEKLRPVK